MILSFKGVPRGFQAVSKEVSGVFKGEIDRFRRYRYIYVFEEHLSILIDMHHGGIRNIKNLKYD